jgi:hypothetical protein
MLMAPAICPELYSSAVLTSTIIKFGLPIFCCIRSKASGAEIVGAFDVVVTVVTGTVVEVVRVVA